MKNLFKMKTSKIRIGVVTRLIGLIAFICGTVLMAMPFVVIWLFAGINKANVIMSTVMRYPMNMVFGEGMGDALLEVHEAMDKGVL